MRIKEILTEVGDNPYPVRVRSGDSIQSGILGFNTPDKNIMVYISYRDPSGGVPVIQTDFYTGKEHNTHLTGGGDQFRILSTVKYVLEKYLPRMINYWQPRQVRFVARSEDKGRIKLYSNHGVKLVSRIIGPSFRYDGAKNILIKDEPHTLYVWTDTKDPVKRNTLTQIISKYK